jgi:hypothetical protein
MPVELGAIPENMTYSPPTQYEDGETSFVAFSALDRSSFTDGQTMKIRVHSLSEFLVPQRSYLRYNLKLTGTGGANLTAAAGLMTSLGGAAVLSRVKTTVAGTEVENINHYYQHINTLYRVAPVSQQNFLKQVELYNYTDDTSHPLQSATGVVNGAQICHALRVAILENEQYVPLPYISGGLDFEVDFATALEVSKSASVLGYTISDVQFVACLLKPTQEYMRSFEAKLQSGASATMNMQVLRNIRITPSTNSEQEQYGSPREYKKRFEPIGKKRSEPRGSRGFEPQFTRNHGKSRRIAGEIIMNLGKSPEVARNYT